MDAARPVLSLHIGPLNEWVREARDLKSSFLSTHAPSPAAAGPACSCSLPMFLSKFHCYSFAISFTTAFCVWPFSSAAVRSFPLTILATKRDGSSGGMYCTLLLCCREMRMRWLSPDVSYHQFLIACLTTEQRVSCGLEATPNPPSHSKYSPRTLAITMGQIVESALGGVG